jgi:inner membrane protein
MDIQMLYWHWLVMGVLLIIGEIFIPSFTILWFGLGALVVGTVALLVDMPFSIQVLLWTISSVVFTVLWFRLIKPRMEMRNNDGLARESAIGESGQVIKLPAGQSNGSYVLAHQYWVKMNGSLAATQKLDSATAFISKRFLAMY